MRIPLLSLALAIALVGCNDETPTAPRDVTPPSAPRAVYSVTGDGMVTLHWLQNPERDLAGYRIYTSTCANGPACPYDLAATTSGVTAVIPALANGVTRFFAVAAFDHSGNESDLSYDDVFDTPRPAGSGLVLGEASVDPDNSGWDFSSYQRVPFDDIGCDIYFAMAGGVPLMVAAYTDTDIQDAGYAGSLDAVNYAPAAGWSPSGSVELIPGHNYILEIRNSSAADDFQVAKFRVTSLMGSPDRVQIDWAYQTATGNDELRNHRPREDGGARVRRTVTLPRPLAAR